MPDNLIFKRLIGVFTAAVFVFLTFFYFFGLKAAGTSAKISLVVSEGEGLKEISSELSRQGLIRSVTAFKIYTLLSGQAGNLKPGTYEINGGQDVLEIVKTIAAGPFKEVRIRIPEGSGLKEIDALFAEAKVAGPGALLNYSLQKVKNKFPFLEPAESLEGFLPPDTYNFYTSASPDEVVGKMLGNYEKKQWHLVSVRENWFETFTVASLLEKEVPFYEDRRLVAGVLFRRLDIGMPLQVDATICYIKTQLRDNESCYPLGKSDFKIDSPYNTYLNRGLPPGPIANVSESALQAALDPEKSPYLYYLSDPKTKKTIFSKTLDEHNSNRRKYLGI